jgi:hypothetical protein
MRSTSTARKRRTERPRRLARLALALLLCPAAGAAQAGALRVTATPPSLRLADGSRASLRIVARGEPPELAASVGRIDRVRELQGGVYEADYVPPDGRDPQIAFVTAATGDAFAWVPIPLSGVRDLVIPAPRNAIVRVTVGDEAFGAIPGAGFGEAVVRVVVPPGVRHGTWGRQTIELGVPDPGVLHVSLQRSALDANAKGSLKVRVLAVTERGERRAGAAVQVVASEGRVSRLVETEPGLHEAEWAVEPGPLRQATLTARMSGRPGAVATATLDRVPGPARSVRIETDRAALVAGEGDEVAVTARLLDVAGNPTDGTARLFAQLGTGDRAQLLPEAVVDWQRSGLVYTGRVRVPGRRAGQRELELTVLGPGELAATRTLALLPGPPREVRVEPEEVLYADGRARALRVSVLDREGNPVEVGEPPSVTVERGALGPPVLEGPGAFRFEYRAPLAGSGFSESVRARHGGIDGDARIPVRAMRGAVVLAPKAGFTWGTDGFTSPAAGLELGLWMHRSLGLVLEAGYSRFSRSSSVQGLRLETESNLVALQASLAWRRPLAGGIVWLGAGGGGIFAGTKVRASGPASLSEDAWSRAAHGSVGWGRPLGFGLPFGELKAAWQGTAGDGLLRGSMTTLTLSVGYRFDVL